MKRPEILLNTKPNPLEKIRKMLIQRLNMDNSWLIGLDGLTILVDPWLEGTEIDFFPWFNTQWHRTKPLDYSDLPKFDAVLITQKYPDHYHKVTLKKLNPSLVIVPSSIEKNIKKLLPEAEIISLGKKSDFFQRNGVKINFFASSRLIDPIYDALLISDEKESLFLATHGYFFQQTEKISKLPIKILICPFNEFQLPFFLGGTISPGLKGILHLSEKLNPEFIVATHDEDKHAKGLVIKTAKITKNSNDALNKIDILNNKILEIIDYKPVIL
jgi:L-ascorbate metabolism protein UlaG (beta-lactamase superfamily)